MEKPNPSTTGVPECGTPTPQDGDGKPVAVGRLPVPEEETVKTDHGSVVVAVQGDRSKPHAILTYHDHDLGLNYVTNFQYFFGQSDMTFLFQNFCVYHMNAPGQQPNADTLPETFEYPTMDQLAEQVGSVLKHFDLKTKSVTGFGVGAGANIMCRYVLTNPKMMDGLILLNCVFSPASVKQMEFQNANPEALRGQETCPGMLDYLLWHHFGEIHKESESMINVYRRYFQRMNPRNLRLFVESFMTRTTPNADSLKEQIPEFLQLSVLAVTGDKSPYLEDTLAFHSNLNPVAAQLLKLDNCGVVMEEQPRKLMEKLQLFLQKRH